MKHPRHVVGAILTDGSSLLMVRSTEGPRRGLWGIPGGSVEWGETLEQAVKRELREECNLDVAVHSLYRLSDFIVKDEGEVCHHYVISYHRCSIVGGDLKTGSDAIEARWIPVDRLEQLTEEGGVIGSLLAGIIQELRHADQQ